MPERRIRIVNVLLTLLHGESFRCGEVEALKYGIPLKSNAHPTLLDIEQSLLPSVPVGQSLDSLRPDPEGSDTIE